MLKAVISLSFLVTAAICDCSPASAISLPVTDVLLSNGKYMRGVWASLGTPPQNLSFFPKSQMNDTWVYNSSAGFCDDLSVDSPQACLTLRGGQYDPGESSSSTAMKNVYAAGADPSDTINSNQVSWVTVNSWVTEEMHLGDDTIHNYPIGMAGYSMQSLYFTQASIGLDFNSTLLTALQAAGTIGSRAFSWWWGLDRKQSSSIDGSIVFGGYDAAKTKGPNYTQPIGSSENCGAGLRVEIVDLTLEFTNGSSASLIRPESTTFSTCIVPEAPFVVTFPADPYWKRFQSLTKTYEIGREGSPGSEFWGVLFDANNFFDGDLTISLGNGFNVRIPNEVMFVAPQYVDGEGNFQTNSSVREFLVNPLSGSQAFDSPVIGKQFLSQAYLMIDYDSDSFTLWEANPTSNTDVRALQKSSSDCDVASPGSNHKLSDSPHEPAHRSLSAGANAGIVAGTAVGAAAFAVICVVSYLRHRRSTVTSQGDGKNIATSIEGSGDHGKPELDANQTLGEMEAAHSHPHELPWQTNPVEISNDAMRHEKPGDEVAVAELE